MGDAMKALRAVLRREWADLSDSLLAQAQLLWLPVAVIALLWAIFSSGTASELPLAIVDLDHSSASRQLVRSLDASPGLAVDLHSTTLVDARAAVRRGDVEGIVLIPTGFRRTLKRGEGGEVTAWFNAQFLLTGNTISRELQSVVLTYSAQVSALSRLARGESPAAVAIKLQPIAARRDSLHNPYLNYVPFLVAGLAAAVVQMFAMLGAVRVVGRELRDGTAGTWLAASGGRIGPAVTGKLVVPTVSGVVIGAAFLGGLHGWLGWPMPGSWMVLLGALILMVVAYEGLGLLVVGLTANYRLASSVAAFVTAPALAFAGLTFPLGSMPAAAEAWGRVLPLTAFVRVQLAQAGRGAPASESVKDLVLLAGAALISLAVALPLLHWRARNPKCWGRQ
jgi:ABC-2 type transport system permease protein